MSLAHIVATRSTCLDKQVGCVLVDQDMRVVSCGYNGAPYKAEHCTDLKTCAKQNGELCRAQHAEINALVYAQNKRGIQCYCTLEPCQNCARMLRNAGIASVFFAKQTSPEKSGKDVFKGHWEHVPFTPDAAMPILHKITEYHKKLGYPVTMTPREDNTLWELQVEQGRDIILAMHTEISELLNSFTWKPWKRYNGLSEIDKDNFLEELGDVIFFMDSLLMNFGLSWPDVFSRMDAKLVENYKRIENGYHN